MLWKIGSNYKTRTWHNVIIVWLLSLADTDLQLMDPLHLRHLFQHWCRFQSLDRFILWALKINLDAAGYNERDKQSSWSKTRHFQTNEVLFKSSTSALFLFKESEKKGQDLMFIIGLCASTPPSPPSQLREIGVSIFPLSHNMTSKINPKCKKEWRLDATENQDWQTRGSGVEGRGGAVIVSGKMVWQKLIRLAELWLYNEQPPPTPRHSHLTMLSTMNTHATRFSIAALRRNQIKEQIIRMEQKQKTEKEGTGGWSWKLCGEVSFMCEHRGSQDSPH